MISFHFITCLFWSVLYLYTCISLFWVAVSNSLVNFSVELSNMEDLLQHIPPFMVLQFIPIHDLLLNVSRVNNCFSSMATDRELALRIGEEQYKHIWVFQYGRANARAFKLMDNERLSRQQLWNNFLNRLGTQELWCAIEHVQ